MPYLPTPSKNKTTLDIKAVLKEGANLGMLQVRTNKNKAKHLEEHVQKKRHSTNQWKVTATQTALQGSVHVA